MALAASYFRSEEFILMAFIQICLRGQRRNLAPTHGGLTVSDSDVEEGEKWHRRKRNKRETAAYDSESNPAISCIPSQSCSHTFHIWWWYLHGGKAWAYGSGAVLKFLCSNSGKRSGSVFRFDERKGIHCLLCPLIFFRGSCHNIIYYIYLHLYRSCHVWAPSVYCCAQREVSGCMVMMSLWPL